LPFSGTSKFVTFAGMKKTDELKSLLDEYSVPGFRTLALVQSDEKDPTAFALTLIRRQKKRYVAGAAKAIAAFMIEGSGACVISIAENVPFISLLNYGALTVNGAA
jgi:hypothetical protein